MARKPSVSKISMALDYDPGKVLDFAGDILEDVNDHNLAFAMWSLANGDYALAKDFIQLEEDQEAKGEGLTQEISDRRDQLMLRFDASRG